MQSHSLSYASSQQTGEHFHSGDNAPHAQPAGSGPLSLPRAREQLMRIDRKLRGIDRHAQVLRIVGQSVAAAPLLRAYAHRLLLHGGLSAVIEAECSELERRQVLLDVARMLHFFRAHSLAAVDDPLDSAWCDRVLGESAGSHHFSALSSADTDDAVYAVGASLTQLFHPQRLAPFHSARDASQVADLLDDGDAAPEVYAVDAALRPLLEACLSPVASARPRLDDVLDRLLELAIELQSNNDVDSTTPPPQIVSSERERAARAEQARLLARAHLSAGERASAIDNDAAAERAAEQAELERMQRESEARQLAAQRALDEQVRAAAEAERRRRILSSRCPSGQHGVGDYCYIISSIWQ
jgi:hypothetical protein